MVLGFFFPCYLFCAFVCCLLMAMLHVYIYREKLSCCGVFICSCIFSVRTGEVTLYNFTQFYASSCLKIKKKKPNKSKHFCCATENSCNEAVHSKAESRQGVASRTCGKCHTSPSSVCSPTQRWQRPGPTECWCGPGLGLEGHLESQCHHWSTPALLLN